MLDRIKALMAARQLSPSQFADQTTLPRPVVSHILSGRNKPSLEAAQKIMTAFPEVSIDWLLNGRGPMMGGSPAVSVPALAADPNPPSDAGVSGTGAASAATPSARPKVARAVRTPQSAGGGAQSFRVAAPLPEQPAPARTSAPDSFAGEVPAAVYAPYTPPSAPVPPVAPAAAPFSTTAPPAPQQPTALVPPAPSVVQQVIRPERVVRRILVFYSDGTFSDHRPLPPEEATFF